MDNRILKPCPFCGNDKTVHSRREQEARDDERRRCAELEPGTSDGYILLIQRHIREIESWQVRSSAIMQGTESGEDTFTLGGLRTEEIGNAEKPLTEIRAKVSEDVEEDIKTVKAKLWETRQLPPLTDRAITAFDRLTARLKGGK